MTIRKTSVALVCAFIAAGAFAQSGNDYVPFNPPPPRSQATQVAPVQPLQTYQQAPVQAQQGRLGTVEGATAVVEQQREMASGPGTGVVLGAFLGGLFGRGISTGTTAGRNAATVAGAVAGGLIGNQVGKSNRGEQRVTSYRMNVRLDDGTLRSIEHPVAFANGTRVVLQRGSLRLAQASDTGEAYYAPDDGSAYSNRGKSRAATSQPYSNPARASGLEG